MNSNAIIEVKRDAYIQAAHDEYMRLTKKTYDELKNYAKSEWGYGVRGDEFVTIEDAVATGQIAADNYLENEAEEAEAKAIAAAASAMGRRGGSAKTPAKREAAKRRENVGLAAGRKALAALTPEQRRENARKAASARWAKKKEN